MIKHIKTHSCSHSRKMAEERPPHLYPPSAIIIWQLFVDKSTFGRALASRFQRRQAQARMAGSQIRVLAGDQETGLTPVGFRYSLFNIGPATSAVCQGPTWEESCVLVPQLTGPPTSVLGFRPRGIQGPGPSSSQSWSRSRTVLTGTTRKIEHPYS